MENIAELYYTQLAESNNPGPVLNKLYYELFKDGLPKDNDYVNRIITFNKLIKLYGRYEVYFAILELASWDKFDPMKNPYGIISTFIINRLEKKYASRSDSFGVDLDPAVRKMEKLLKELEKEKIELPETFHNGDH